MLLDHAVKSKVVPDLGLSACLLGLRTTWRLSGSPIPTGSYGQSSRRITCYHRCWGQRRGPLLRYERCGAVAEYKTS
jgi:hypothetical protein